MKKTFVKSGFLALALISALASCSKKEEGYVINGNIAGQKEGIVYLEFLDGDKKVLKDSAVISDGKFTFAGKVQQPLRYSVKLKGAEYGAVFILSNETIDFKAPKDSVYMAKISGAAQDSIYQSYYKGDFKKIQALAGPVYKLSDSLTQNGKAKPTAEQQKMLDKRWADLQAYADSATFKFIRNNKDNVAGALILEDRLVAYGSPEQVNEYFAVLSPKIQKSYFGKKIKEGIALNNKYAVGVTAPDFSQKDVNGNIVKLSDYKGKYVLLDFWASWCGPCRKENPNVVLAYKKYHDKGFEILGVSLDDKKNLWQKAIEKDGLTWTHVSDLKGWKNEAAKLYIVKSVPTNFLIGPDGKIVAKNLRAEELQAKLKEIFNKA